MISNSKSLQLESASNASKIHQLSSPTSLLLLCRVSAKNSGSATGGKCFLLSHFVTVVCSDKRMTSWTGTNTFLLTP